MNSRANSAKDMVIDAAGGYSLPHMRESSLDDAFSDSGDDSNYDFTSDSIRKELAENMQAAQAWRIESDDIEDLQPQLEHSAEDPDASVSTIDINAPPLHGSHLDPTYLSLPLSPALGSPLHSGRERMSSKTLASRSGSSAAGHHAFPSVIIDVSKSPTKQVTILARSSSHTALSLSMSSNDSDTAVSESSAQSGSSPPKHNIPTSLSLPGKTSDVKLSAHRISKSTGPSVFEQVLSKTRPAYLPPKEKQEDRKHLADWEAMMKQSRVAEDRKKKLRQERRLAREQAVEDSTTIWEKQILPDWKNAMRDTNLRKLWWNGIPPKLRGAAWEKAIGNALALSKDTYRTCLSRALRALASGTFPTTTLNLIEDDIRSTLPTLHIFTPSTGPLFQDLKDLLYAWVVSRSDEGLGYFMGASKIAAMLLLNMQPQAAFVSMRNLLERHCMRSFYGGLASKDDVEAYYRIFDTLLADCMPKIYFNFKQHQVSPIAYLPSWLITLFLDHLPLEACARIWDVLVLEGDSFLYRAALSVLAVLEPRLFFPDRQELLDVLRGENKAALEVAHREGKVLGACKYEIYDVVEDNIWEEIDALGGWWKESTWARLIQRELPDL